MKNAIMTLGAPVNKKKFKKLVSKAVKRLHYTSAEELFTGFNLVSR